MSRLRLPQRLGILGIAFAAAITVSALPASAQPAPTPTGGGGGGGNPTRLAEQLVRRADGGEANRHLIAFQRIAEQNAGNRAANTSGYDASVEYVAGLLRGAGYLVETPEFSYQENLGPDGTLVVGDQTFTQGLLTESIEPPAGGISGALLVAPEDADGSTGCEAADYDGLVAAGAVVVIRRGVCTFEQKADVAIAAGAATVVIANNAGGTDLINGTLGNEKPIPVGYVDAVTGDALIALSGQPAVSTPSNDLQDRVSRNIIAQTRQGRTNNVVMAGAHLDSVPEGAGINDNGTGSAGLLEVALELGGNTRVNNAVRFAWWGAEELGLLGSEAYVAGLTFEQQLDISMYLNFDMIGSPNAAYFTYDGDDSDAEGAGAGPFGSAQIEATFNSFLGDQLGVPTEGTDFDGRSDYGGFIAVGIPSGGLFTGAEDIKTEEQVLLWGGTAGVAYDPCYHSACDNLGNVDRVAFDRNIDAIAWAVGLYGTSTEEINGVPPRDQREATRSSNRVAVTEPEVAEQAAA